MTKVTVDLSGPVLHRRARWLSTALLALLTGCQPTTPTTPTIPPAAFAGDAAANSIQARVDTGRAFAMIQRRDYADARPILERAILADTMYGPAHNDLGLVLFHLDLNYGAAWEFDRASKLMPQRSEPFNNLGLVYERAAKWPEAEAAFQHALDRDPMNSEFAGNLARIRIRLNERDETTRKLLQLVVSRDTRAAWINWARINLYRTPPSATPATMP